MQATVKRRPPGNLVLFSIVALGMGVPALYRWQAGALKLRREEWLQETAGSPEARLAEWFLVGQPQIHHALQAARFSDGRPWFVTHVVAPKSPSEPPEIYGIDLSALSPSWIRREAMVVRVELPAPVLLARDVLSGDKALGVPVFPAGSSAPDARALALDRLVPYLARLEQGLARDLANSSIEIWVGGLKETAANSEQE